MSATSATRDRTDRCPGIYRPWPAEDGGLVRLRLAGGRLSSRALVDLVGVAEKFADAHVHLTARANLQLRALPMDGDRLPAEVVAGIEATGLLPSRTHELVRNIMASPQSGLAGGRAKLRPVVDELDRLVCSDPRLAELSGRFLFVLDDGRGDLVDRSLDLGAVAISPFAAQLRVGSEGWGAIVPLAQVPRSLVDLAHRFLDVRGEGPAAAWHVDELDRPLAPPCARYSRTEVEQPPLGAGDVPGGHHYVAAKGAVDRALAERVAEQEDEIVVTPWRGLLVPSVRATGVAS
jgi:sulfite reductase beta subunit-like hemoprotein